MSTRTVRQSGNMTPGHIAMFVTDGVIGDSGIDSEPDVGARNVAFDTVAAVEAADISGTIDVITVNGYYIAGDGGGDDYKRVVSQPDHSVWIQSLDGAYWVPVAAHGLSVLTCGAIADGTVSGIDRSITGGTDNWQFIQNAVDAHTYYQLGDYVHIPIGLYRITNTIQCGYGANEGGQFHTTHIIGSGPIGLDVPGETFLLCDFSDRPGLVFQGQRSCRIEGVGFWGKLWTYIQNNNLSGDGCSVDDAVEATWVDPSLDANCNSETAPYAAIAIDPYLGSVPSPAYPDVIFPAFLGGGVGQYDKVASSNILIEKCVITGFCVAVVNHPNNDADQNGDFLCVRDSGIANCIWGISVGHTQSRNVHRERVDFSGLFACETTSKHGFQNGKMNGISLNCSVGRAIFLGIFDNDASIYGPLLYQNLYCEATWAFGNFNASTGVPGTEAVFDNCNLGFGLQEDTTARRGVPALTAYCGFRAASFQLKGGQIGGFASVLTLYNYNRGGNDITIDGTLIQATNFGARSNQYEWFASNVLQGGLVLAGLGTRDGVIRLQNIEFDVDSGSSDSFQVYGPLEKASSRGHPCSAFQPYSRGSATASYQRLLVPDNFATFWIDKGGGDFTVASITNKELQFTLTGSYTSPENRMRFGPFPGDVLVDQDTGSVFFVHYYLAGVVRATLQNNYYPSGGGNFAMRDTMSLVSGYIGIINSRIYTPEHFYQGDITNASANVTNAGMANGDTSQFDDIANDDWYLVDNNYDNSFSSSDTTISALAAGSFTLGSTANYTETRKRFGFFIRPGPANS